MLPSTIKPVCNIPYGKSFLECRFLKVIFNFKSAMPRYQDSFYHYQFKTNSEKLCELTTDFHRLALLLCLTAGQRDQTIKCLNLNYITISSNKVVFFVPENLKTTRPGHHLPPIQLKPFKGI